MPGNIANNFFMATVTTVKTQCYHCGEDCDTIIAFDDKAFCCDGCKMVYKLLNKSELCEYYNLNNAPGINRKTSIRKNKFAFLDDEAIASRLISFKDGEQTRVTFYLPQMHCSSCLYLLENLHKLDAAVISSRVNFPAKEITIIFSTATSLRKVAELLADTGYEPYISLNDIKQAKPKAARHMLYKLGVAGFCFANIMLLSFPEYLGLDADRDNLTGLFRIMNFILALPVVFYSAIPFYTSAIGGLKHRFLNIDAPIVLAIAVTFGRSIYEILTGTGSGYFDSMSGIVFFMLAGRIAQDRTYAQLSFDRDYTSYFPVAVTVIKNTAEVPVALPSVKTGDTLLIHHDELVPADGILTKGKAWIDYSFVTGEAIPVLKEVGEIVYAGGRQTAGSIEVLTVKDVSQSYLTTLWENADAKTAVKQTSFVHLLSRYFTYILFAIAFITAIYWFRNDAHVAWRAVTSILIVACPCALLLSNTFTNGHILRILSRHKIYLKNAGVIEGMAKTDYVVFDKTGTLTYANDEEVKYTGNPLSVLQQAAIAKLAAQSNHPLSRVIAKKLHQKTPVAVTGFKELPGQGIEGAIQHKKYRLGSPGFIKSVSAGTQQQTEVWAEEDGETLGCFTFSNHYRNVDSLMAALSTNHKMAVLSGDNDSEKQHLEQLLGKKVPLLFYQKPEDKLRFIKTQQQAGCKVMMIGDGLNDAPSLQQSDVGIAVADGINNFTPACDAIIEASQLPLLHKFMRLCSINKRIVIASFILSILYNIVGLSFAVQGKLSPLIAAILMPASSLSILLLTFGSSYLFAKYLKL